MARAVIEPRPPIDAVAKDPLTFDRIRRGIARRIRNRSGALRDLLFLRLAAVGGWLASLYYATVSPEFWREHVAVVRGRERYRRASMQASAQFFRLRRNVHRLEKGLIMRPRRPTFALDYIGETVDAYARLVALGRTSPEAIDEDELRWAHDVLTAYFAAVAPTKAVTQVRARFDAAGAPPMPDSAPSVPYARDLSRLPSVDYDALLALSQRRRSVRWYRQEPVPRELVDRAIEVAAQAPSACNRQPFEFRIIDEPAMLRTVASIPPGTGGFADNLPAMAVIVGKLDAFAKERDRHLIYIDGALAAMAFVYALETQGLSSCCINWADAGREERAMREVLQLRPEERVVMLIAFGYPDPEGMVPYSAKVPLDILRRFN